MRHALDSNSSSRARNHHSSRSDRASVNTSGASKKTSPKDWSSDTITGHNTSLTTSRTRSHSSASKHRRVSCVSQKATDAPSGSSVPSKKTSCGLDTSVPSKTCASHSLSFGTDTTTGGSSNVTATRRPNRLETHSRRLERPPEYTHPSVQTTAGFTDGDESLGGVSAEDVQRI